jgi:hypothetical protein
MIGAESQISIAVYVSVLVAIIGWVFVYNNSRSLARQSESNAVGASIEKMLQEISDENYKYWRDAKVDLTKSVKDQHLEAATKGQAFSSFVELRCNFVENKILVLHEKCKDKFAWMPDTEFRDFGISLVAQIRDQATFDSEKAGVMSDSEKLTKILKVNALTFDLFSRVGKLLLMRYRSVLDSDD